MQVGEFIWKKVIDQPTFWLRKLDLEDVSQNQIHHFIHQCQQNVFQIQRSLKMLAQELDEKTSS